MLSRGAVCYAGQVDSNTYTHTHTHPSSMSIQTEAIKYGTDLRYSLASIPFWGQHIVAMLLHEKKKTNALFVSVNVFRTKVLIGDTIFTSSTGDGTAISTWSSEPREGPTVCSAKAVSSFLSYFKTLSIGPAPGIEPATSRFAVKRSTY